MKVALQGWGGPEDVAILMAQSRGYFEDVGLNVWAGIPAEPARPVGYVATRVDEVGVAQEPQIAIAKARGAPVIAVGSLVSQPTAAMIWLKGSKVGGLADLEGKTIGVPGIPYQERFLRVLLGRVGLTRADVRVKKVGYDLVPNLLDGKVDAIFGGSGNREGVELESRGTEPVVKGMRALGMPAYEELLMVVRTDRAAEDPQSVRDFISAVVRGAAAAVEDPEAAVDVIVQSEVTNPDLSRAVIEAQVKATLPLLSTSGYMDPDRASGLVDWMDEEGMIRREATPSELLTNDFLPSF